MKNLSLIICFLFIIVASAQDTKQSTMEKRARELHRAMGVNDKEQWKKFVNENYSAAMLERPQRSSVETSNKESSTSGPARSTSEKLDEKLKIFERLHSDFGESKIISLKVVGGKMEMIIESTSGLKGNFVIEYAANQPYLIDKIAVEANMK